MYNTELEKINLEDNLEVQGVVTFLEKFNLSLDSDVDYTLVMRENHKIKATCSKAKNVFKCFAVDTELRGEGITATLVSALMDKLFEEGMYHSFIFTKPDKIKIFTAVNYKLLYETKEAALLENGIYNIEEYIDKIIRDNNIDISIPRAALVMNCNPFTLGHQHIIELAAESYQEVLIFIVEEEKSIFSFKDRYNMVKQGVSHLKNVKVIPGGEYIISEATFPSYFLKKLDERLVAYTTIDAGIFGKYFCNKLNIKNRFVGEEKSCKVTNIYNNILSETLSKFNVDLKIIKRLEIDNNIISASTVRGLIKQEEMEQVKKLVPYSTWNFLNSKQGKETMERIKIGSFPL